MDLYAKNANSVLTHCGDFGSVHLEAECDGEHFLFQWHNNIKIEMCNTMFVLNSLYSRFFKK